MEKNDRDRWGKEKRTATEYVKAAGDLEGSVWALARRIGIKPEHLWTWVSDARRGFRRTARIKLRDGLGLPTVAILERERPIGEVVKEEREKTG